ncbi:MAG: hypothetical protein ACJAYU_001048 [Bradymonadia bacterium]
MVCLLPAHAAAERVESFDAVLTVQADGVVTVQETIVYDFEDAWRPGIFRDLSTRFERNGADVLLEYDILGVTDGVGRSQPFHVESLGPIERIVIGDTQRLTTGRESYIILYTSRGGLRANDGAVELAWHVNGTDWAVPIDSLSAEVRVLSLASSSVSAHCLLGGYGEFGGECVRSVGGALRFEASETIPAGSAMALTASFLSNFITPPSTIERSTSGALARLEWWMLGPLIMFLALILRMTMAGRRSAGRRGGTRVAPPARLRPAQAGVIWDDRFDMDDLVATLIDLAVRGHIEISQDPVRQRSRLGARQFRMTRRTQLGDPLEPYEELLIEAIFELSNSILTSNLRNRLYTDLQKIEDAVYASVVPRAFSENPRLVQRRYGTLSGVLIVLGLFSLALSFPYAREIALAMGSSGVVALLMARWMPGRTHRGARIRSELWGLRNHLELAVERSDLDDFELLLPFAIVLGAADPWIGGFRGSRDRTAWLELSHGQQRAAGLGDSIGRFAREVSLHMRTQPAGADPRSDGLRAGVELGGDW